VGSIVFFKVDIKKKTNAYFWLGPITSKMKIIMDVQLIWAKFQNCPISTCLI